MSDEDGATRVLVPTGKKMKETTADDRRAIFIACRASFKHGRLRRGIFQKLAIQLGFKRLTIYRQWRNMSRSLSTLLNNHPDEEPQALIDRSHHILFGTRQSNRHLGKFKYDREQVKQQIKALPFKQRRTLRNLSARLNIPLTTVHFMNKPRPPLKTAQLFGGVILCRRSSSLKPTLKNGNKVNRFLFCASEISTATVGLQSEVKFQDQMDKVHIDEKYLLVADEEDLPKRHVGHKICLHGEDYVLLCPSKTKMGSSQGSVVG
jgi:hypothetical protein